MSVYVYGKTHALLSLYANWVYSKNSIVSQNQVMFVFQAQNSPFPQIFSTTVC